MGRKYPRKGEFGSTMLRCEWCGKKVPDFGTFLNSCMYNDHRVFCSRPCRAAGKFYTNIVVLICTIFFLSILFALSLNANLTPANYGEPDPYATLGFFEFIFGGAAIWQMYIVYLGFKVRNQGSDQYGSIELRREDLTKFHRDMIEFIEEYPANNGVPRKVIIEHMSQKGINLFRVHDTLRELVYGGILQMRGFSRYVVIEEDESSSQKENH